MRIGVQEMIPKVAGVGDDFFYNEALVSFAVVITVVPANLDLGKGLTTMSSSENDVSCNQLESDTMGTINREETLFDGGVHLVCWKGQKKLQIVVGTKI